MRNDVATIWAHCMLCFHGLHHQVSPWPQVIEHHHGLRHQASPVKSTMRDEHYYNLPPLHTMLSQTQSSSITMASVNKYHHGLSHQVSPWASHQASPWPQSSSITYQVNHARLTLLQSAASACNAFMVSVIKYHLQDEHHYNLPPPTHPPSY